MYDLSDIHWIELNVLQVIYVLYGMELNDKNKS